MEEQEQEEEEEERPALSPIPLGECSDHLEQDGEEKKGEENFGVIEVSPERMDYEKDQE